MRAITETARALNRASLEAFRPAAHTERLLRLWFILGGAHNPVLVLLLLFCQDLDVPRRHARPLRRLAELLTNLAISESKWFLSAWQEQKKKQIFRPCNNTSIDYLLAKNF